MRTISRPRVVLGVFLVSSFFLVTMVPAAPIHARRAAGSSRRDSIPAAEVVNPDGTLNLKQGENGSVDLAGWNVSLDPDRGPVLTRPDSPVQPDAVKNPVHSRGLEGGLWWTVDKGLSCCVNAIAVKGSDVYVGGTFTKICFELTCNIFTPVNHIAKWNGTAWSTLDNGVNGTVRVITIYNTTVYVGGDFTKLCNDEACTDGTVVNHIARWEATGWFPLRFGVKGAVYAIAIRKSPLVLDRLVYVGGSFTHACGNLACNDQNVRVNNIARWFSASDTWGALGNGVSSGVQAIAIKSPFAIADGDVYAGGAFAKVCENASCSTFAVTVNHIARWDHTNWFALQNGLNGVANALAISGSDVYVGGSFNKVCSNAGCTGSLLTANNLTKWNGSSWSNLGTHYGVDKSVHSLVVSGGNLYIGGEFEFLCGNDACESRPLILGGVAKYSGSAWTEDSPLLFGFDLGAFDQVKAVAVNGTDVYAGGDFAFTCDSANTIECTGPGIQVNNIARFGLPSPTVTPTPSRTQTPTRTATPTATNAGINTPTATATRTGTNTRTPTATNTRTITPTATSTSECSTQPAKPQLVAPAGGATVPTLQPVLKWAAVNCASTYNIVVQIPLLNLTADSKNGLTDLKFKTKPLTNGFTYKWFVRACNGFGCTKSAAQTFTVQFIPTATPTGGCSTAPAKPQLLSPNKGAIVQTLQPVLKWAAANCASTYNVKVKIPLLDLTADSKKGLSGLKFKTKILTSGLTYKWFVQACNGFGCTKSASQTFTVQ